MKYKLKSFVIQLTPFGFSNKDVQGSNFPSSYFQVLIFFFLKKHINLTLKGGINFFFFFLNNNNNLINTSIWVTIFGKIIRCIQCIYHFLI